MPLKDYLAKALDPLLQRFEDRLEQGGHLRQAQQLRRKQQNWRSYESQTWEHFRSYVKDQWKLRFLIQREAHLQLKHDTLFQQLDKSASASATLVTETESLQNTLQDLNRRIWTVERDMHTVWSNFPDGPLKRAMSANCRNSDWYLSEWLQADCAGVGGCCARGCGCCMRARSSKRSDHRGHCTSECTCCEEARGFKLKFLGSAGNPMAIDFGVKKEDINRPGNSYTKCLINAYVWGL
ncbi:hypothetical protein BDV25DRAFT_172653 [Aspergillus avenaceus]|uniref:Uncharacterized protein n=1 Tax=Aspergillus avenaceus TaxID=36643 RepID=A0A5N6TTU7_ASPAV|nr:hypothetical protein BDV25DRAFT_172653 [Aspergillus avenaceus]